jgi:hypothetical protein
VVFDIVNGSGTIVDDVETIRVAVIVKLDNNKRPPIDH